MISPSIVDFLTRGIQARGRAILFVPNFQSVYALKRELAAYPSLRGGVVVVRAEDWLRERWGLWADRALTPITSSARVLTIRALLDESSEAVSDELTLSPNQGTIDLISELVECVLPELVAYVPGKEDTPSLAALVRFGARYQKTIHAEGRCELIETIPWLCESFTRTQLELPFCVAYGFCGMSQLEAMLFEALARLTEFRSISEAASREEAKALATSSNASVSEQNFEPHSGPHSESNFDLHSGLHQLMLCLEEGRSHTLDPSEDVRLLLPAGAHAEAELIAHSILEDEPASAKLLLTSPDPRRMFEELAPKLCAHAVEVSATLNQMLMSTETARAIFEYLSSVSELMILNESWPLPSVTDEFTTVDIPVGHMQWWPPTKLIDFLMSSCAHTSLAHSYRLDALWRGNRLLTPADVLKTLTNPHSTSSVCARSCSLLMHGKLLQALSILAQAYLEPVSAEPADYSIDEYGDPKILSPRKENAWQREEARTVILKLMALVKDMQERPEFAPSALETPSGLARAIETLQLLAHCTSIVLNPKLAPAAAAVESEAAAPAPTTPTTPAAPAAAAAADISPRKRLYIAAVTDASELEPASFDTVYITGQTSEESPLPDPDSLATSIAQRLHVLHKLDPQAQFRSAYAKLMRLASHRLVFERVLFDRTGHVTYPSCILSDVLDCYKLVWDAQAQKFVNTLVSSRFALHASEEAVSNNLRIAAAPARMCASERPRPQGSIDSEHKELLCIAPAGTSAPAPHLPFVSASQIEAYLRCPYQWFCERRLALSELDAQCSQLEAGTFVHRVLELTHARLLTHAQERVASQTDPSQDEELYIPGSRADYDPAQAHDLLDKMFDMHKTHQYIRHNQKKYMREQIFVPHTVEDEGKLDGMRRDLHSFIDYESTVFQGFSPRFFELSFGKEEPFIQYGGAYVVGSIDRVDVDAHNNAIVIDYKNRSPRGFEKEYALSLDELIKQAEQDAEDSDVENSSACSFALPQHIQTLIYARMLSRLYPQLNVVGALYVSTKNPHAISGACDAGYLARIVGEDKLRASLVSQLAVPETFRCKESNEEGFAALLDAVEHMLSGVIASMQAGHIAAPAPSAEHLKACLYCRALLRNQHMTSLA